MSRRSPSATRAAVARSSCARTHFLSASTHHAVGSTQLKVLATQGHPCSALSWRLLFGDGGRAVPFTAPSARAMAAPFSGPSPRCSTASSATALSLAFTMRVCGSISSPASRGHRSSTCVPAGAPAAVRAMQRQRRRFEPARTAAPVAPAAVGVPRGSQGLHLLARRGRQRHVTRPLGPAGDTAPVAHLCERAETSRP